MRRWLLLAVLTGCFHPSLGDTPYKCGASNECPPDYMCGTDGLCRTGGGASGPDARPGTPDARPLPDARPGTPDARPLPDGAPGPDGPACTGGFLRCTDANTAVFCNGGVEQKQTCAFRCDDEADLCEQCDPGIAAFCVGDVAETCGPDGQIAVGPTCPGFCQLGRCRTLEPSNLPATACDVVTPALGTGADGTINTTSCDGGNVIDQGGGAKLCVIVVPDFGIDARATVTVTGSYPLAIVALHDIAIAGTLDAAARGTGNGPGASDSGTGKSVDDSYGAGGGGGGFAQSGGGGGTDQPGVVSGGGGFGIPALLPITGGSPGGRAGVAASICTVNCPTVAVGGGAGGGVELVACHALHIGAGARILALGGGGGGGFASVLLGPAGGGGGGGAGGGILLESPAFDIAPGAAAVATGGGGGGGGDRGGDSGQPGAPGAADHGATGGAGGDDQAGSGGNGATGTAAAPTPGPGGGAQTGFGGGGGGGAAGRIRINARKDNVNPPANLIAVPPASFGGISSH